jgi:hypothetical protein
MDWTEETRKYARMIVESASEENISNVGDMFILALAKEVVEQTSQRSIHAIVEEKAQSILKSGRRGSIRMARALAAKEELGLSAREAFDWIEDNYSKYGSGKPV